MQDREYLNTEQAADYLNIKERKLYELVGDGAIPCSKVTGKWLFPRSALDRWVLAGMSRPQGFVSEASPPIIGGSHDLLLEWTVRQSGCGLALLPEGSEAGLARLIRNQVGMAALHLHGEAPTDDETANPDAVRAAQGLHDCVLVAFARREQVLLLKPGNPLGLTDLAGAVAAGARFGLRQAGAGAQLLLQSLAKKLGLDIARIRTAPQAYATGQDLALAIRSGDIDCGVAARSVATLNGLDFLPLVWERYDLAMRRRMYFEPGPQAFFAFLRTPAFARQAELLQGYDVAQAGGVRLNA